MPLSFPSNAASSVLPAAYPLLAPNGTAIAPSFAFTGNPGNGFYNQGAGRMSVAINGANAVDFIAQGLQFNDVLLIREAAATLAQRNGATQQIFRVYRSVPAAEWIGFDLADAAFPIIKSSFNMQNNAAAQAGTLTNAPVAGNPTKWIPINDNGTIRNIPAW